MYNYIILLWLEFQFSTQKSVECTSELLAIGTIILKAITTIEL